MNAIDFMYDENYLSDYGFIICEFNAPSGADFVTAGSLLTFNKVSRHYGKSFSLSSSQYNECIETSFDICKNPDLYDDMELSSEEIRDLMRWLVRREFYKFQVLDDERDIDDYYYMASFNVEKIKIHDTVYGLHLKMETDKPFAYGKEFITKLVASNVNDTFNVYDTSDEIGYIYPHLTIKCSSAGNLIITNSMCSSRTVINNCTVGETITIDGDLQVITTSNASHAIYDDFNFDFFQIGNKLNDRLNIISVSLPCQIEIRYNPIIKDTP